MEDNYFLDQHPIGCVQYSKSDSNWQVTYANAAAKALFEVAELSAIDLSAYIQYTDDSAPLGFPASFLLPNQRWVQAHLHLHTPQSFSVWISDISSIIQPLEKKVSDAESYKERILKANKAQEDFAYTASHDLQAPLRKIQSFARLLSDRHNANLGSQGQDYLRRITDSARHMELLINDLLSFSRFTRHDRTVFERLSVLDVLNNVLSETNVHQSAQVDIKSSLENPDIDAAPMQLFRLLQNIIENAMKFVRPDVAPRIQIDLSVVEGQALPFDHHVEADKTPYQLIQISDNGVGFSEENAERIFRIFQRLHGKSEYLGTGIGLAICKKIVENHKGFIRARAVPMEGATFIIALPVNQS
jgi:signal transduction histidine kinase